MSNNLLLWSVSWVTLLFHIPSNVAFYIRLQFVSSPVSQRARIIIAFVRMNKALLSPDVLSFSN